MADISKEREALRSVMTLLSEASEWVSPKNGLAFLGAVKELQDVYLYLVKQHAAIVGMSVRVDELVDMGTRLDELSASMLEFVK